MGDTVIHLLARAENDNSIPAGEFCYACREARAVFGALCADCARDAEAEFEARRGGDENMPE